MSGAQVTRLFPTPVFLDVWDEAGRFNEPLRQAMLAERGSGRGVSKSNFLGWQSDVDMLRWGGEAAGRLRDRAIALCEPLTDDELAPRKLHWRAEMWGNISGPGASNQTHSHPGSFWSVVYYVDDGYGGAASAGGGELTFLDPRFPMVQMRSPSLRARFEGSDYDHPEVTVRPRTGLIVIFPSWLPHSVRPYQGAGERMSIAINLMIFGDPGGV